MCALTRLERIDASIPSPPQKVITRPTHSVISGKTPTCGGAPKVESSRPAPPFSAANSSAPATVVDRPPRTMLPFQKTPRIAALLASVSDALPGGAW